MTTRQLDDRLRAANPVELDALARLDLDATDEELLAAILAEPRESAAGRRRAPRLPAPPRLARAALVAVLALALGVAVLLSRGGGAEPALAQVLDRAAQSAAQRPPSLPGPSQFLYVRSEDAYMLANPGWSVLVPSKREVWLSADGTRKGRVRQVIGEPRFVSPEQRAGWTAAGSPPLPRPGAVEDSAIAGGFTIATDDLPTDPPQLRALIEARAIPGVEGPPGEAETFVLVGDLLREPYLPAGFRAALYRVIAELPGVELLGTVTDPAGREGTGVAYTDQRRGVRSELIFDPATATLLAERETTVGPTIAGFRAPVGTTVGYAVYLEAKVVDSVGAEAPAGAGAVDDSVGCYDRAAPDANVTVTHSPDPLAKCAELWAEGVVDTRGGPASPDLVACRNLVGATVVLPGSGDAVCRRLGYAPVPRTPAR